MTTRPLPAPGHPGFTLAEVLIALAIMALLGTFLIPKALEGVNSTQTEKTRRNVIKQNAAIIQSAYSRYKMDHNPVPVGTTFDHLTSYIDYIAYDTSTTIDENPPDTNTATCDGGWSKCLKLKNGSIMMYGPESFNGSSNLHGITITVDPDGVATHSGQTDGIGKSVLFWLYYDGKIRSNINMITNSCNSAGCPPPWPASELTQTADPYWFTWD